MIEIEQLTKQFGDLRAVDDVSLAVPGGEFFVILGPNAAGKTTTIKVMAGLMKPTSGSVRICGFDIGTSPIEARRRMAYVPDFSGSSMTSSHRLSFSVSPASCSDEGPCDGGRAEHLANRFQPRRFLAKPIESLSHGTKQRVAIVSALMHSPEVVVFDEPMVGLDPHHSRVLKDILREQADAGVTVFVSTHQLSVAEEMADRIGIMHQGRLVAVGSHEELQAANQDSTLESIFLSLTDDA